MTTESAPGARHVPSPLMRQTLLDRDLVLPATDRPPIRLLPWLSVVKVGGRSIMDRGRDAVLPLAEELKAALADHKLLITTGGGIRSRHLYSVGLDLGLPTGVLAALAGSDCEQNGHILAALLAEHNVAYLAHTSVGHQLPLALAASPGVVGNAFPPYDLYEFPPEVGKLPPHRADAGTYLIADAWGAKQVVYAEDVDGVFTADPNGDGGGNAELIREVGARELLDMNLATLPVDRALLELMGTGRNVTQVQVVNGLVRGTITRALAGEHVGTIIRRD